VRQFAADASHELRTPLTTIRGYAELYRQGALDDDQLPDAMRRIEQEARRMSTLVAELLELARLDRTTSLDITETDLSVLVRDAAADARAVEPARPVRAEAPESLIAVVDEARIRQVLANLLGNVREHTPVTTPTAVRLAQVRGGVVLEVADSGPGMAAEDAARAFDRFHRGAERHVGESAAGPAVGYGDHGAGAHSANGTRSAAESGGSGLGLAIVAAIAQAHGGQATMESAPGHGTRVRVWLPATAPAPPAPPRVAATPRPSRARHHPAAPVPPAPVPVTPQLGNPPSHRAGPSPQQPLSGPARYPATPPWQQSRPPVRQPLPDPADGPAPWHAAPPAQPGTPRPTRQPLPGPADGPAPWHAAPPAQPGAPRPTRQPLPDPADGPPPWHAAPPAEPDIPRPLHWPLPGPADDAVRWHAAPAAAPHPGDGRPEPAEVHHDWGNPPRPVPPACPPDFEFHDADGHPPGPAVAPWQRLPRPGRHGRFSAGPQRGDDGG
jgi:Histidine kinase-, DNA gyrase B-, and HSP90-like ATPase/His Kinase A (phospho-acceptor) domain